MLIVAPTKSHKRNTTIYENECFASSPAARGETQIYLDRRHMNMMSKHATSFLVLMDGVINLSTYSKISVCIYINKRNIIKSIRIRIKISLDCSTQAIILLSDLWHSLTHDTSFSWLLPICLYNSIFSTVWCLLSVFCFFVCFFRFPYVSSLLLYIRVPLNHGVFLLRVMLQ